jgi:sugar/nucleoside kinase (ribokinase family)
VIVSDDHHTRTWFPYLPSVAEALTTLDLERLTTASYAYIDCYQLIEAARQANVPMLVNLGGSSLSPAAAAALQDCRRLVVQTSVDDTAHETAPPLAASLLDQTHASWAIVTAGASGAVAISQDGNEHLSVPAFQVQVRYTHCAGAAFSGGLLYGLLHDWPMEESLTLASASGALRCERAHHDPLPNLAELRNAMIHHNRIVTPTN